jgi:hypothetical protein
MIERKSGVVSLARRDGGDTISQWLALLFMVLVGFLG